MIATIAVSILCLLIALFLSGLILRAFGKWLMAADPLQPASCIVVLGGYFPWRVLGAASIYHDRWAPEVWLTQRHTTEEQNAAAKLGIELKSEQDLNRLVLERLGVPTRAISLIEERCIDTAAELRIVALQMQARGCDRPIILVTSKAHARRVKTLWKALAEPSMKAIVRYTTDDPFSPDRWFLNPRDAERVAHEFFGLLNVWTGFPIKPEIFNPKHSPNPEPSPASLDRKAT